MSASLLEVDKRFPELKLPVRRALQRHRHARQIPADAEVWRQCPRQYKLSIQEIRKVLAADPHSDCKSAPLAPFASESGYSQRKDLSSCWKAAFEGIGQLFIARICDTS